MSRAVGKCLGPTWCTSATSTTPLCSALLNGLCAVFTTEGIVCVLVWGREMDGFCGQMCMKSGANGVRSWAAGRGQGVGWRRRREIHTHTHTHTHKYKQRWFRVVVHTHAVTWLTPVRLADAVICVSSSETTYCNTANLISPALSPECHHLSTVQWIRVSLRWVFPGNLSRM